jgi:hypothetical protein
MKYCYSCDKYLNLDDFAGDLSKKDKLNPKCKVCCRSYSKQRRINKGWVKKEKQCRKTKNNEYRKNRCKTDSIFKFKCNTRSLIYNSFKRACNSKYKKSDSTENLLGCSLDFFMIYIENQFKDGMNFDNYGLWHLDHIKPISKCKTKDEVILFNHYTNFQPLWALENLLKSNK